MLEGALGAVGVAKVCQALESRTLQGSVNLFQVEISHADQALNDIAVRTVVEGEVRLTLLSDTKR